MMIRRNFPDQQITPDIEEYDDGFPEELSDYELQMEEELANWDGWTINEISDYLTKEDEQLERFREMAEEYHV